MTTERQRQQQEQLRRTTTLIMQLGMTLVRKRAVGKTSQALREGQPKLRQQMVELGGVAVVTVGGGTTSTATASGVAALQQGQQQQQLLQRELHSRCISICILVCNNLPLLPPTPYCFFFASRDFDYLVTPTNKQPQQQTICISFKMMCIYDEIDTTTTTTHPHTHMI